jgi:hypothetical protein
LETSRNKKINWRSRMILKMYEMRHPQSGVGRLHLKKGEEEEEAY